MEIESLIGEIEATADPATTARVRDLVEAILEFHGSAIERMLELAPDALHTFGRDPLVSPLLLLYGFHPEDFETRVRRALDSIPNVEVAAISGLNVRVRAGSRKVSRAAVEQALYAAAPEIASLEFDGASEPAFVPVEAIERA